MEVAPLVTVAAMVGGYVVRTEEYDVESKEWNTTDRVATSIREVVTHVIHSLEAVDRLSAADYKRIEQARPK